MTREPLDCVAPLPAMWADAGIRFASPAAPTATIADAGPTV
jgi:hypothetical protein